MSYSKMIIAVLLMAIITYLIRAIPLTLMRKKFNSRFIMSLLYYIPYAVLSAMTFPYILYSTDNIYAAFVGTVVAIISALCKKSLVIVAILSCISVLILQIVL